MVQGSNLNVTHVNRICEDLNSTEKQVEALGLSALHWFVCLGWTSWSTVLLSSVWKSEVESCDESKTESTAITGVIFELNKIEQKRTNILFCLFEYLTPAGRDCPAQLCNNVSICVFISQRMWRQAHVSWCLCTCVFLQICFFVM